MNKFFDAFRSYIVPVIIVFIVIFSCSMFLIDNVPHSEDDIKSNFSTEKIVVSNSMLLTDLMGKNLSKENMKTGSTSYIDFDIKSKSDRNLKYEIVLEKEDAIDEVPFKFVKFYLTDDNDQPIEGFDLVDVPSFYELKVSETSPGDRILYSGSLKDKDEKKFKLRVWIADTYELSNEVRIFSAKLKVIVK